MGFPGSLAGKESTCNAGDLDLIPGLGISPGEGKGYPLQYSGVENSMDSVDHGVAKSQTQLSDFHSLTKKFQVWVRKWRQERPFFKDTIERKKLKFLSGVQLFATLWTVAQQDPLSIEFSRQEHWVGCYSFLQRIFPTQGLNPVLLHCRWFLYWLNDQGSPIT